jgi:hypothetical protein
LVFITNKMIRIIYCLSFRSRVHPYICWELWCSVLVFCVLFVDHRSSFCCFGLFCVCFCQKNLWPSRPLLLFIKCLLIGMLECWCSTKCFIYTNLPTKYFSTPFWPNALPPVHVNHFWNCRKSTSIHFRLNKIINSHYTSMLPYRYPGPALGDARPHCSLLILQHVVVCTWTAKSR